jgi:hypothetical protein
MGNGYRLKDVFVGEQGSPQRSRVRAIPPSRTTSHESSGHEHLFGRPEKVSSLQLE